MFIRVVLFLYNFTRIGRVQQGEREDTAQLSKSISVQEIQNVFLSKLLCPVFVKHSGTSLIPHLFLQNRETFRCLAENHNYCAILESAVKLHCGKPELYAPVTVCPSGNQLPISVALISVRKPGYYIVFILFCMFAYVQKKRTMARHVRSSACAVPFPPSLNLPEPNLWECFSVTQKPASISSQSNPSLACYNYRCFYRSGHVKIHTSTEVCSIMLNAKA